MPVSEAEILKLVRSRRYRPMTAQEIAQKLRVPEGKRPELFRLIEELKLAGELVEVKHARLADPERVDLLVGTLLCNPRGFGFIRPARERDGEDLFVSGSNMSSAMHGDLVVARVPRAGQRGRRRSPRHGARGMPDVKIVSVLRRARTHIVGTFFRARHVHFVVPDDPRLFRDVVIAAADAHGARHEDKVRVRVLTWPSRHINPTGEVVEVFGPRGRLETERLAVVHEYDLRHEFPQGVLRAAERVARSPRKADLASRTDLTREQVFTIDPEDAKDFDDAVSLRRLPRGEWELGVHIADVSHYVRADDPLDTEARRRSTSVYLPGQVIPMLPEQLSNDVCSLRPRAVRLTKTVRLRLDRRGKVLETEVFKSVIRSVRRFTYKEVQRVLEGGRLEGSERGLEDTLRDMHRLAELLRAQRRAAGMLELDIAEPRIITDRRGRTTGIELHRSDDAHRLIEHFMLAANEAVARYLLSHRLPYICRAHDEPDPRAIREFRESAAALGYNLPAPGTRSQLQRFLARVAGKPEAPILHYLLLRSLPQAEYSAEDRPHYAIGAEHYLHFTSPIRRYPDMLVHRILDEYWSGELKDAGRRARWEENLPALAAHSTEMEHRAESAERTIVYRRMKEFLATRTEPMEAMVIAAESYGMRVQLCDSLVEGVVRMSSLTDGFYRVDRVRRALVGPRRRSFRVGDVITVRVAHFDPLKYQIEFEPVRPAAKR